MPTWSLSDLLDKTLSAKGQIDKVRDVRPLIKLEPESENEINKVDKEVTTKMPYIEFIKLGLAGLSMLIDIVTKIHNAKQSGQQFDAGSIVTSGSEFLSNLGVVAKIKELNPETINAAAPHVAEFINKIGSLKLLKHNQDDNLSQTNLVQLNPVNV